MLQLLKRAIGLVLGTTKDAGHVLQTVGCQTGGSKPIAGSKRQAAPHTQKAKRNPVQRVKQAPSRKTETSRAQTHIKQSKEAGTQPLIPAPLLAPQNTKPKHSAAKSTKVAQSRKLGSKVAPVTNGVAGKQVATPALKTRHHAKSKVKLKP